MDAQTLEEHFIKLYARIETLVEVNQRLIDRNIYLSDKLEGNPVSETNTQKAIPQQNNSQQNKKKLYYVQVLDSVIVSGSGTFDSKDVLKENGFEWVGEIKAWRGKQSVDEVVALFPDIEKKKVGP